jgi:acyl-CoA synthetase (AMP-forming)/AMP-acid ligase II
MVYRLHDIPAQQAASSPDSVALWWQGTPTTYAAFNKRIQQVAAGLSAMGNPGDRVAVLAWNCPEFVELIYAASAAGQILVPLNARLAPAELIHQLLHSGVSTLFADPALLQTLSEHPEFPQALVTVSLGGHYDQWRASAPSGVLPEVAGHTAAWILFTSGTTGKPKGAVLTHHSFLAGLESAALGRPVHKGDRYYYPFPLFHVAAHNVLLQHRFGAAVVLAHSFDAGDTLRACRERGITTLSLAPTMIAMLLDHPDFKATDLQTVRTIGYGASNMPPDLLQRLLSETAVGLCQSYGMTELSGSISFLTPEDHRLAASGNKPGLLQSVGKPLTTVKIRLATQDDAECPPGERGEILVQAPQCMAGYWQDPSATDTVLADRWLHTGDVGLFDEEGYLYIVDRKKDMIISGGENVASREVEDVLRAHPAVKDCAVVGLPDNKWGETVTAVIVLAREVPDEDLTSFCREYLGGYKTPRQWIHTDALPVNAAGKVDKASLRRTLAKPGALGSAILTGYD